jgi:hypothetical protein
MSKKLPASKHLQCPVFFLFASLCASYNIACNSVALPMHVRI